MCGAHETIVMDSNTTYHGNCHCGAYRFEVALPKITEVIACDCSLCAKKGHLWVIPSPNDFKVTRDDGELVEYRSGVLHSKVRVFIQEENSNLPRRISLTK